MNFLESFFTTAVCLGLAAASSFSTKYLPPALGADSGQYSHHHQDLNGAASRSSPNAGYQYATAVSVPVHSATKYGQIRARVQIPILRNQHSNDGSGNYNFGFETGNGIRRDESGHLHGSWPGGSLKVSGSYSYTGDDGKIYSVNYKADSNGFHAEGDHLPTPPPIPREIQETLHLHQNGVGQRGSASSYASSARHSNSVHHRNLAATSQFPASNLLAPNTNYLPPQQSQGYNYGSHY